MEYIMQFINTSIRILNRTSLDEKIMWTLVVVVLCLFLSKSLKGFFYKRIEDSKKYYPVKQKINYITGAVISICTLFIWMDSVDNLTTYMGLLSAGVAIALKEPFTNIAGWLFIEFRKPFGVGHRISIGDIKGDVIDKRLFQFTLMEVSSYEEGEQSTGRIIDVPNGFVFIHPTVNYTKGFEYIWNEIKVLVTFESNWKVAKELLLEIVNENKDIASNRASRQIKNASKTYMIHYKKLTPIVYTDVKESGIQLTIRYLCEPKKRRNTVNNIWEKILEMIESKDDIELAYPTQRIIYDK